MSAATGAGFDRKARLADFLKRIWDEGEADAVDAFIAQAYTIAHDPGDPWDGQTLTRDGFRQRLIQSRAPFPDQKFTVVAMIAEGDSVAVTWLWAATHQGDLPGFPATGKPIAMSGMTVYRFEGDRLAGHWQVCDRLGVYGQLMANAKG